MATYVINIEVDKKWVPTFNKSGTKLCFAHGVADTGSENTGLNFNVVSSARDIYENISLTWTDMYSIAGGNQSFSASTKIVATTAPKKIEFKQSVTLNDGFLLDPTTPDATLGEKTFAFLNKVIALVYLYNDGPNLPGRSKLTPKPVTRLFFAKHYESGTMIDDFQSEYIDVDLTDRTSAAVKYDAKGHWIPIGV